MLGSIQRDRDHTISTIGTRPRRVERLFAGARSNG
jgi:hypothetical protein